LNRSVFFFFKPQHFRHTARLINSLIRAQKHYELLLFPDERHSPRSLKDRIFMEQVLQLYVNIYLYMYVVYVHVHIPDKCRNLRFLKDRIFMQQVLYVCVCTYLYMCTCIYIHRCTYSRGVSQSTISERSYFYAAGAICMCMYIFVHMDHMCINTCTCIYIHIHVYIYIHVHIPDTCRSLQFLKDRIFME